MYDKQWSQHDFLLQYSCLRLPRLQRNRQQHEIMQLLALVNKTHILHLFLFPLEQYSTFGHCRNLLNPLTAASPEWCIVHGSGLLHNSSIELITEDHKRSINYKKPYFSLFAPSKHRLLCKGLQVTVPLLHQLILPFCRVSILLFQMEFSLRFFRLTCTIPYEGIKEETFRCHLYFGLHSDQYVCFWHRVSIKHSQFKRRLSGRT